MIQLKRLFRVALVVSACICCTTYQSFAQSTSATAAKVSIIPLPAKLEQQEGFFIINKGTAILAKDAVEIKTAEVFNAYFSAISGYSLPTTTNATRNVIILTKKQGGPAEGYTITSSPNAITVTGNDNAGMFYGMQTVMQLIPTEKSNTYNLPLVAVEDAPRFGYRGLHLDVSRHFFSIDFIKKFIDLLAMHKMNTFHWHLTDDQGWRIEIKKFPKLQTIASQRKTSMIGNYADNKYDGKPYGGFYTQTEVKDVVKYASERFVTVIPEIEMPGHALAALTAYPELGCTGGPYEVATKWGVFDDVFCAGNDQTFTFLQDVLDEVMPLFPSKLIHIGGDECPKTRWKVCPKCQARMKANNLKDEHALQSYFIQRMEKYINSKGKQIIGWDEILEGGLAPNAAVMSWRGMEGGIEAAKQQHDVVMTPGSHLYFDHYQARGKNEPIAFGGFTPVSKVYSFEPIPKELSNNEKKYIKGAQANLWTEYILSSSQAEYMEYPRATALAEVLWSPADKRNYDDFMNRLKVHFSRLDVKKVNYAKHVFDINATVSQTAKNQVQVAFDTKMENAQIRYTLDGSKPTMKSDIYRKPIIIKENCNLQALIFVKGEPFGNGYAQPFVANLATGKEVTLKDAPADKYNPGNFALVNGIEGSKELNDEQWLGWNGKNMEAVVDLGKPSTVKNISFNTVHAPGKWIYKPKVVTMYASNDGRIYRIIYTENVFNKEGVFKVNAKVPNVPARFIKIVAENFGTIPAGAPAGAGSPAWFFIDEIIVE
ncbi:hexosaminidase [Chitinophaga skermanii]|uniref:beta-N-acetylhexosaminidase n=1 Tax=Chitinophaga skermanii TaxID=331697 RepID=A0A327Q664_9BACT|nr:glycoside hydrolase family 20 protein [Chitinophaga skermanii]RAI99373.1 hexosaminidase [Chitinophaga skermanii]